VKNIWLLALQGAKPVWHTGNIRDMCECWGGKLSCVHVDR
jgi:hypothetical protein